MKDSRQSFSIRSLLALILVLGLSYLAVDISGRLYYGPLCRRYGDAQRLTYVSHSILSRHRPAECFFRDAHGNMERAQVSAIPLAPDDRVRWALSWVALIGGAGASVLLASLVGGFKPRRRRR